MLDNFASVLRAYPGFRNHVLSATSAHRTLSRSQIIYVIHWVMLDDFDSVSDAYSDGQRALARLVQRLQTSDGPVLSSGCVQLSLGENTTTEAVSNMTK